MTSVKTALSNFKNVGDAFIKSVTFADNNDVAQHKSISHGNDFNTYQTSLKNKSTEGFGNNTLTQQSRSVLLQTDMSNKQQDLLILKQEYAQTQNEYDSLKTAIASVTANFIARTASSNPYLNKFIRFTSGHICYVTNLGIAKYLGSFSDLTGTGVTYNQSNQIQLDYPIPSGFFTPGTTIPTTPPLISGTNIQSGKLLLNGGENVHVNTVLNNKTASYVGCYVNNNDQPMTVLNTTSRDFASCKQDAIDNGYKYFALQDKTPTLEYSLCGVTNDLNSVTQTGNAYKVKETIVTWATSLASGSGSIATLLNIGSMVLYNSTNQVVYSTPGPTDSNYIGCYADTSNPAISNRIPGNKTYEECLSFAEQQNSTVFGLQNVQSNGTAACFIGDSADNARQNGLASNCTRHSGNMYGGGLSNAVYSVEPGIACYLIVMDNGNMCIYRGVSPQDNQGLIWQTNTSNNIHDSNAAYSALKGKYGKNWISVNDTLIHGDFVGSTNGKTALVMGADGNLKLTTWIMESSCATVASSGNMVGIAGANAIYETQEVGIPSNLGKYAYVDPDYNLYSYHDNILAPPTGVSTNTVDIDSVAYSKYPTVESISDKYSLANLTSVQRQQLNQLETRLSLLANRINTLNVEAYNNVTRVNGQLNNNSSAREDYVVDIKQNRDSEEAKLDAIKNIQNILNDSDIMALQHNYSYIFFAILAAASVLVAMNIVKN